MDSFLEGLRFLFFFAAGMYAAARILLYLDNRR